MSQGKLLGGMEYIIAAESMRNYHMNFTRLYRDKNVHNISRHEKIIVLKSGKFF